MAAYTYCVPTLFGLEGIASRELKKLGLADVTAENGNVLFRGDFSAGIKANLCLRTGERILILLKEFEALSFDDLFEGVKACPLEEFIPRDGQFPVKGSCLDSQLHSVPDCQAIIKKAAAVRLGRKYHLTVLPETGALYQLRFQIFHNRVRLFLDTTGDGLHKRGYRAEGAAAPLRETLAASLVEIARWRGKGNFADPFCGSGTIPIEAALIAKNRAPGLQRHFSCESWAMSTPSLWRSAREEAVSREFSGDYHIFASDIDPAAVKLARHNAELAGVADCITFSVKDARQHPLPEGEGALIANPPYGRRLLEQSSAREILREFGRATRGQRDYRLYVLSADMEFEKYFGRRAVRKRKLYNGMIPCELYMYYEKDSAGHVVHHSGKGQK